MSQCIRCGHEAYWIEKAGLCKNCEYEFLDSLVEKQDKRIEELNWKLSAVALLVEKAYWDAEPSWDTSTAKRELEIIMGKDATDGPPPVSKPANPSSQAKDSEIPNGENPPARHELRSDNADRQR